MYPRNFVVLLIASVFSCFLNGAVGTSVDQVWENYYNEYLLDESGNNTFLFPNVS